MRRRAGSPVGSAPPNRTAAPREKSGLSPHVPPFATHPAATSLRARGAGAAASASASGNRDNRAGRRVLPNSCQVLNQTNDGPPFKGKKIWKLRKNTYFKRSPKGGLYKQSWLVIQTSNPSLRARPCAGSAQSGSLRFEDRPGARDSDQPRRWGFGSPFTSAAGLAKLQGFMGWPIVEGAEAGFLSLLTVLTCFRGPFRFTN